LPLGASTEAIETVTGLRPQALLREIPIPFCILGGEELRLVYANVAFERTFRGPVVAGLAVADVLSTPVVVGLRDLVLRVRTQGYGEALEVWTPTGRFDFLATALAEPPGAVAVVAREAEAHASAPGFAASRCARRFLRFGARRFAATEPSDFAERPRFASGVPLVESWRGTPQSPRPSAVADGRRK